MDGSVSASVRERLLEGHQRIDALLGAVLDANDRQSKEDANAAWRRFADALVDQLDAEDPLVAALPYERGARVLVNEHRHLRERLADLENSVKRGEDVTRSLRSLRDVLRAHAQSDDRLLYRWMVQELSVERKAALADALARALNVAVKTAYPPESRVVRRR